MLPDRKYLFLFVLLVTTGTALFYACTKTDNTTGPWGQYEVSGLSIPSRIMIYHEYIYDSVGKTEDTIRILKRETYYDSIVKQSDKAIVLNIDTLRSKPWIFAVFNPEDSLRKGTFHLRLYQYGIMRVDEDASLPFVLLRKNP